MMPEDFPEIKRMLEEIQGVIVSAPSQIELPAELALCAAAVAVTLPPGCRPPPGPLGRRIAAGWGRTAEEAATKALLEGVERYSIQYREGDPPELTPWHASAPAAKPYPANRLLLGHPDADRDTGAPIVTSVGSAAGISVEDAAVRGLLENLEHEARRTWLAGNAAGIPVDVSDRPELRALQDALHTHHRRMALFALAPGPGVAAVLCVNCAEDGADAVVGSAAATDLATACHHAAVESALLWRNMLAMSQRGLVLESLSAPDREHVVRFLQGWPLSALPGQEDLRGLDTAARKLGVPAEPTDRQPSLAMLLQRIDRPCLVFDLTRPEAKIAVARVKLLDAQVH